jgi:tetratricopeptide (TPR) repeat protein
MNQDLYTVGNLFERTDCISKEMLLKYVQGQLAKPMLRQVELHLIDCPLCSDAVEGIQLAGTDAFEQMLQNVTDRVEAQQAQGAEETDNVIEFRPQVNPPAAQVRSPKRFIRFIAIAASFVLLAVVAIMLTRGDTASGIADRYYTDYPMSTQRSVAEGPASIMDAADELYLAKDYAAAVALYDQVGTPAAIYLAGTCYFQLGKYDLSVARYQAVIDQQLSWVEYAEYYLALSYLKLDKVADAQQLLQAIAANADHNFYKQANDVLKDIQEL